MSRDLVPDARLLLIDSLLARHLKFLADLAQAITERRLPVRRLLEVLEREIAAKDPELSARLSDWRAWLGEESTFEAVAEAVAMAARIAAIPPPPAQAPSGAAATVAELKRLMESTRRRRR